MSSADSLLGYHASAIAAGFAAGIFGLVALLHILCYFAYRAWYFHCMVKITIFEAVSFGFHLYAINNNVSGGVLASELTSILLPSIMAIACFMTFDRIVWYTTTPEQRHFRYLWVPARHITSLFVVFDLLSFAVQLAGARRISTSVILDSESAFAGGADLLRVGLILQLLCFGLFGLISARFLTISRDWEVPSDQLSGRWKQLLIVVNVAMALFTLRIVYRLVQFVVVFTTQKPYLTSNEWVFYALDAAPVFVVSVLFIFFHPARALPKEYTHFRLKQKKLKVALEPHLEGRF